MLAAGALAVASLLGAGAWAWRGSRATVFPVTLAVLPFDNLGNDPEGQYLADGLTEETTASLGAIDPDHLTVKGRTSTMRYKRTTKSLAEIGHELAADYLVQSTVQMEGERGAGNLFSRNSRLARAFAIVSWSVAPTAVPSTMIGPLKPNDFSFAKSPAKSTLPVPNWIITSSPRGSGFAEPNGGAPTSRSRKCGPAQSFATTPVT